MLFDGAAVKGFGRTDKQLNEKRNRVPRKDEFVSLFRGSAFRPGENSNSVAIQLDFRSRLRPFGETHFVPLSCFDPQEEAARILRTRLNCAR
jgi:hypothetical protein